MSGFSNRLQILRDSKGWTKTYVAKHLGIKMQTYANYEYGLHEPDLDLAKNIANLYGVTTDYLISGKSAQTDDGKTADLADDDVIFTYQGKPLSEEDKALIKRLMNGKE
ncbi:helix-turn-helix domain-containing protein [Limosilactobacillus vaginalis]|uniref:Helix-turn-helix domain-containing protein n=1 Tax=Limosilactobacillus vaginalis TaxID=1633 RepID=A0ABT4K726_9LACO|nr:helix-turn-helix transcriptional regulator [Limosilactobacillus vaginalis]MCZ3746523.1 helix-turn-helix domain-containing protein [Limosilactobacillus vaginalis]MCZ3751585.1 helix-turn-helix domain-containing protein [Limosilactobacillus vaginalis]MCZ3753271.1 helix-turn-helix domain-containing protein [Limosilactobacillus vaginalis]MCZ3755043.1 helix-turn-helix domain-containing protein [Limosilactobacillus vaginalis]MCZ3756757.1 helix-turn-helix domain-containing protein [Limosilactobacil